MKIYSENYMVKTTKVFIYVYKKVDGKWKRIYDFLKPYHTHKELKEMCVKILERLEIQETND